MEATRQTRHRGEAVLPKRANLKPPNKCIFDGKGGLTKAHIFPDWLRDHITERTDRHIHAVGLLLRLLFPEHRHRSLGSRYAKATLAVAKFETFAAVATAGRRPSTCIDSHVLPMSKAS